LSVWIVLFCLSGLCCFVCLDCVVLSVGIVLFCLSGLWCVVCQDFAVLSVTALIYNVIIYITEYYRFNVRNHTNIVLRVISIIDSGRPKN
jgi:hypothetical protein